MHSKKINRRELIGAMGAAAGAAVAFGCGSSPDQPDVDLHDHDDDHRHQCGLRGHADRNRRPLPVADGSLSQRHPRRKERDAAHADGQGRQREQRLRRGLRRQRRDLARRRRRQLLAVRHPDDADVSSRDSDDQQQRRGHVHHHLPGLVSGPGHAHPSRGDDQRPIGEGDADRVSRNHQQHGARQRRLRRHEARTRCRTPRTGSSPTACRRSSSRRRATPPADTPRRSRSESRSGPGLTPRLNPAGH